MSRRLIMPMIVNRITHVRALLRTLQRAPEPVRKRWLFGASATAMALVVLGWVLYLNASLAPIGPAQEAAATPRDSFFSVVGKGFSVIGTSLAEEWEALRRKSGELWSDLSASIASPTTFSFVRETPAFTPAAVEPVPPATLPLE